MIDYSENLKKGDLESLKLVSRLLTGTAIIVDKLVSFLIEMSDSIANYVDLLDANENVS